MMRTDTERLQPTESLALLTAKHANKHIDKRKTDGPTDRLTGRQRD